MRQRRQVVAAGAITLLGVACATELPAAPQEQVAPRARHTPLTTTQSMFQTGDTVKVSDGLGATLTLDPATRRYKMADTTRRQAA